MKNILTVVLISNGVFFSNVARLLYGEAPQTRFDYVALGALFIGIIIVRESMAQYNVGSNYVWSFIGLVVSSGATVIIALWSASERVAALQIHGL